MAYTNNVASNGNAGTMGVFSTMATQNIGQQQKTDFLQMLTYQLKNQNPTKPYDNQEFAQQLATFSQLEQLSDIKSLLNDQVELFSVLAMSMENTALPGMIGKYAKASSKTLDFDGINPTAIGFKTPYPVNSGIMKIKDNAGNLITTIDLTPSQCTTGEYSIAWDGKDKAGNRMLPGKYNVEVELYENDGITSNAQTFTVGKIESVRFKAEGTVLVVNGVEISLSSITDIRETGY